jgi:hypothetical protein
MRVYIESTIPSYLTGRVARDLQQAAHQQLTHDWWNEKRHHHTLFTSQLVLDEISEGDPDLAAKRLAIVRSLPLLRIVDPVRDLTKAILKSGVLPPNASEDASHIALSTVHKMDILLSWNCRHIANAFIQSRLRLIAARMSHDLPTICTPAGLMNEEI